jgi:hypothetical protein
MGKQIIVRTILTAMLPVAFSLASVGQTTDNNGGGASPAFGSIVTPHPINPATDTTNPSARATQTLNPYLGSAPEGNVVDGEIRIGLEDANARGLRFNLGLSGRGEREAGNAGRGVECESGARPAFATSLFRRQLRRRRSESGELQPGLRGPGHGFSPAFYKRPHSFGQTRRRGSRHTAPRRVQRHSGTRRL